MAENTETTIETTVETVNTTEETPLTANPRIRDVSQLQTLVCFHSTPPLYCLPFADLELFVNGGFETGDQCQESGVAIPESRDKVTVEDPRIRCDP